MAVPHHAAAKAFAVTSGGLAWGGECLGLFGFFLPLWDFQDSTQNSVRAGLGLMQVYYFFFLWGGGGGGVEGFEA